MLLDRRTKFQQDWITNVFVFDSKFCKLCEKCATFKLVAHVSDTVGAKKYYKC